MDYTAIGDTTNLASRLEIARRARHDPDQRADGAPGARLLPYCARSGRSTVKGKSEPVVAFEVRRRPRRGRRRWRSPAERGLTPLVGRSEELAQLEACYRRLARTLHAGGRGRRRRRQRQIAPDLRVQAAAAGAGRAGAISSRAAARRSVSTCRSRRFVAMLRQYFDLERWRVADVGRRQGRRPSRQGARRSVEQHYPAALPRARRHRPRLPADLPLDALEAARRSRPSHKLVARREQARAGGHDRRGSALDRRAVAASCSRRWSSRARMRAQRDDPGQPSPRLPPGVAHQRGADAGHAAPAARRGGAADLARARRRRAARRARSAASSPRPRAARSSPRRSPARSARRATSPRDDGGAHLTRPVGRDPAFPASVREVIAARLDRLGAAAKRTAQFAAVLGPPVPPRRPRRSCSPARTSTSTASSPSSTQPRRHPPQEHVLRRRVPLSARA